MRIVPGHILYSPVEARSLSAELLLEERSSEPKSGYKIKTNKQAKRDTEVAHPAVAPGQWIHQAYKSEGHKSITQVRS